MQRYAKLENTEAMAKKIQRVVRFNYREDDETEDLEEEFYENEEFMLESEHCDTISNPTTEVSYQEIENQKSSG